MQKQLVYSRAAGSRAPQRHLCQQWAVVAAVPLVTKAESVAQTIVPCDRRVPVQYVNKRLTY